MQHDDDDKDHDGVDHADDDDDVTTMPKMTMIMMLLMLMIRTVVIKKGDCYETSLGKNSHNTNISDANSNHINNSANNIPHFRERSEPGFRAR